MEENLDDVWINLAIGLRGGWGEKYPIGSDDVVKVIPIEDQPMWAVFKHPAPYKGMKWAVKTPRGVFGLGSKKIATQFVRIAAVR